MYLSLSLIKRASKRVEAYLASQNITMSHSHVLHMLAHVFHYKNYNTLHGMLTKPHVIQHLSHEKIYLLEIDVPMTSSALKDLIMSACKALHCVMHIHETRSDNGSHFFECRFPSGSSNNFLTVMMRISTELKKAGATRIDLLRISQEKESLTGFLHM